MTNKQHVHMPSSQRAKQFLPFDAVAGLREALKVKEHEMGLISREELSDEVSEYINEALQKLKAGDRVVVKFFRDEKGFDGEGDLVRIEGTVTGIDIISRIITVRAIDAAEDRHGFTDETDINIDDITSIDISDNDLL